MPKYTKPKFNYNADDVWAAACKAQRVNGSYVKAVTSYITNDEVLPLEQRQPAKYNRLLVDEYLADTAQITDEDREEGKKVRKYYQAFTFKILKGIKLSDWDNNAMLISNRDIIEENFDVSVIASLPSAYFRNLDRDNVEQRIKFATGEYISKPGLKATLIKLEVVKCIFSHKYNIYFVTGITPSDEVVFFSYRENIPVGSNIIVNGTVKAHRDNSTQLNRVKIVS